MIAGKYLAAMTIRAPVSAGCDATVSFGRLSWPNCRIEQFTDAWPGLSLADRPKFPTYTSQSGRLRPGVASGQHYSDHSCWSWEITPGHAFVGKTSQLPTGLVPLVFSE